MNIQILNYDGKLLGEGIDSCVISKISDPRSLDEFMVNIIDLNSKSLWKYSGSDGSSIDSFQDIANLAKMIKDTKKSKTLILLPQNIMYRYDYRYIRAGMYNFAESKELKNHFSVIEKTINKLAPFFQTVCKDLIFENTITSIEKVEYKAAFHFAFSVGQNIITKSKDSEKTTTLEVSNNLIITTLEVLESEDSLYTFLSKCKLMEDEETYPQWLLEHSILNDAELNDIIQEKNKAIEDAQSCIAETNEKLKANLEYKSILFTQDNSLVKVVFKILEEILDVDLSTFKDERKEDFHILINEDFEFIGEIKGKKANISNDNLHQLDGHYLSRLEKLSEQGQSKTIKALLIINRFREKPISERSEIHGDQLKIAIRNNALIIETATLLHIYERFVLGELDAEKCRGIFKEKIGLLTKEDC